MVHKVDMKVKLEANTLSPLFFTDGEQRKQSICEERKEIKCVDDKIFLQMWFNSKITENCCQIVN